MGEHEGKRLGGLHQFSGDQAAVDVSNTHTCWCFEYMMEEKTRNDVLVLFYVKAVPLGEGILGQRQSSVTNNHSVRAARCSTRVLAELIAAPTQGEPTPRTKDRCQWNELCWILAGAYMYRFFSLSPNRTSECVLSLTK